MGVPVAGDHSQSLGNHANQFIFRRRIQLKKIMAILMVNVLVSALFAFTVSAAQPQQVKDAQGPFDAGNNLFFIDFSFDKPIGNTENVQASADQAEAAIKAGVREHVIINGKPLVDYLGAGDYAVMVRFTSDEYGNIFKLIADKQYLDISPEAAITVAFTEGFLDGEGAPIAPAEFTYDPTSKTWAGGNGQAAAEPEASAPVEQQQQEQQQQPAANPKTGDSGNVIYAVLAALAAISLAVATRKRQAVYTK